MELVSLEAHKFYYHFPIGLFLRHCINHNWNSSFQKKPIMKFVLHGTRKLVEEIAKFKFSVWRFPQFNCSLAKVRQPLPVPK